MPMEQPPPPSDRRDVLIVEDDRTVAQFIRRCLENGGYRVTGIAASAIAALEALEQRLPALVIVDIRLEGPTDGVELAQRIRATWGLPVVFVTGQGDDATLRRLVSTGPLGFVRKPFDDVQLIGAVDVALFRAAEERTREQELAATRRRGEELAATTARLESRFKQIADVVGATISNGNQGEADRMRPELSAKLAALSSREREVLKLLREGQRVASIARELSVSPFTVRNHLRAVFRKIGVHSQEQVLELLRGVSPAAIDALGPSDGAQ
jgi:DNA-binding NarL/FixJ family response regulator